MLPIKPDSKEMISQRKVFFAKLKRKDKVLVLIPKPANLILLLYLHHKRWMTLHVLHIE